MAKYDDEWFDRSADALRRSRDKDILHRKLQSACLQEDRREKDRGEKNRRAAERLEIDAGAKLHCSMKDGFAGRLVDISARGCSMEIVAGVFHPGDKVWMKMTELQHWQGTVRWVKGDKVGVEFDHPFYPAVLDYLVETNRKVVCTKAA